MNRITLRFATLTACVLLLPACSGLHLVPSGEPAPAPVSLPATPRLAPPNAEPALRVWNEANAARGTRIIVSTGARTLWLMRDSIAVFAAPVAVGMQQGFTYGSRTYDFKTPIGRRSVLSKATSPVWTPPEWHYYEKVVERGLEPVHLKKDSRVELSDGTRIEVRGNQVGRVNQMGNFWPFTPGKEIILEEKIFIPPYGTDQRRIADILGTHKLEMGDGYLIHGTNEESSIGAAVSHGCVRMYNADVQRLYELVPVGTPVFIY